MKAKHSILLLSGLLCIAACSDNDNPAEPVSGESESTPFVHTAPEPDYSSVVCDAPVFVTESLKPEVRSAMSVFLTNMSTLDEAEIAVVRDEDVGTYEGRLLDFYNRGGLLVVAEPISTRYREFAEKYGIPDLMPFDASQDVLLYVTCNRREHYVLYASNPFDVDKGADPVLASIHSEDITTYYKRRLFEIFSWVKSLRLPTMTRAATQLVTGFDPRVLITDCDHVSHNFPVIMDHCVCDLKGFLYSDEYIEAVNSVEVKNTIYSAYVFEGNKNPGDYYIILNEVIAHNTNGWQPFNHDHAGVVTKGAGYFMSQLDITSELMTRDKMPLTDVDMFVTPSPGTTVGAKEYSTSTKVGFSGSLSASTESLGSVGFSADYSSGETMSLKDFNIALETGAGRRYVKYNYIVENITSRDWDNTKAMEKDVPLIARKDFNAKSAWCWRVPANTNDICNRSDKGLALYNKINYHYDCMIESNFKMFYTRHHKWNYETYALSSLPHPSRIPFGVLSLKNTHPNTIANVTVWKKGENADKQKNQPVAKFRDAFIKGESAVCALEVGTYCIEYDQINEFDNSIYNSWVLDDITVTNGSDQESSTAYVSTANAKQTDKTE